jgi:hypothetical protein
MIKDLITQATQILGQYLPNILGAVAILVVGWLVALAIAAIVRSALRRSPLDDRVTRWVKPEAAPRPVEIERFATKSVFYLVMLFVLVAFLEALNLNIITEPLNALLTRISEFAPRVLGALLLLGLAWAVATVLMKLVRRLLLVTDLDEKLGEKAGLAEGETVAISKTIADAVYWLVFLLFLPAILGALSLEGLLEPLQSMTRRVLEFVPHIFAAGLIFGIGWLVARLVQRIVTNLLAAAGLDRLSARLGVESALGKTQLSDLIGLIAYVMILIPVLIAALNALRLDAITGPASQMLGSILDAIPALFAAALLLTLAFVVGKLVAGLARNVLEGMGFDELPARLGLVKGDNTPARSPSAVVAAIIVVAIMLFAAIEASAVLGFDSLATLLVEFLVFAAQVALGLVIIGVGLLLANLAATAIESSQVGEARLLAILARVAILSLAAAVGLRQMGLANEIISLAFGLLLGSAAVAAALAFGLGGRDVARDQLVRWSETLAGRKDAA